MTGVQTCALPILLESYIWPGNVRELRNMMERAVLLSTSGEILPEHLMLETMSASAAPGGESWGAFGPAPGAPLPLAAPPAAPESARPTLPMSAASDGDDPEREHILRVLAECGGNQSRAARQLGISRKVLMARLDRYGVARPKKPGPR